MAAKLHREPLNPILTDETRNLIKRILVGVLKIENAACLVIGYKEVIRPRAPVANDKRDGAGDCENSVTDTVGVADENIVIISDAQPAPELKSPFLLLDLPFPPSVWMLELPLLLRSPFAPTTLPLPVRADFAPAPGQRNRRKAQVPRRRIRSSPSDRWRGPGGPPKLFPGPRDQTAPG